MTSQLVFQGNQSVIVYITSAAVCRAGIAVAGLSLGLVMLAKMAPNQPIGPVFEERAAMPQRSEQAQREKPNTTISGLNGFSTLSTVIFTSSPSAPHRFETNYIFPDRTRWWLSYAHEQFGYRRGEFRHGGRVFEFAAGEDRSNELEAENRAAAIRRMELRRALFLWPDGFEWVRKGERSTAALPELAGGHSVGFLSVAVDAKGRPREMQVFDADEQEQETLTVNGWTEQGDRRWPESLQLTVGGESVWIETIEHIDPNRRYVDSFFLPVDRRSGTPLQSRADPDSPVRQLDLPIVAIRNFELPPELDWQTAFDRGQKIWNRESERLKPKGHELDPAVRIEVGPNGRPRLVMLRLNAGTAAPDGWSKTRARTALMLVLENEKQLNRARIDQLLSAIPAGSRPTPAYARRIGDHASKRIQIVLPLVPED